MNYQIKFTFMPFEKVGMLLTVFMAVFLVGFTTTSFGQEKSNKAIVEVYRSLEPTEIAGNINFDELFRLVDNEKKLRQVLLKNKGSQLLIKSNDKKALEIFLKNNESVFGMAIINNRELQPEVYNQLDLNVSYTSYQVEVILSEVKGLIVEKKEKYWISMPNIQLR
jgi:uncharacterized protein (DUF2235 family)